MLSTLRTTVIVSVAALILGVSGSAFAAGSGIMPPQGGGGFHGGGSAFRGGGGAFHSNAAGAFHNGSAGAFNNGGAVHNNGGAFNGGFAGRDNRFHNRGGFALGLGLGAVGAGAYAYGYPYANDYVDNGYTTDEYAYNDDGDDNDPGCVRYRRVYDQYGNYVGRRAVNVCQ
jgi:hypothetical protein